MSTIWSGEDLESGLCGLRWDDTLATASSRLTLTPSSLGGYQTLASDATIGAGIAIRIEAKFKDGHGTLESVTLSGSPTFPPDADVDTWKAVVGPALDAWLAELHFTYEDSVRLQSEEDVGGTLGTLGEGDYDYYGSPSGAKAAVLVLWDEPQWTVEYRGPGAPDFEKDK